MSCSNCYNGCSEITSDKCVRYTGIDVPVLGIKTGDSLSYVEQALIEFLVSTLDGSGIKVDIPQDILCPIVSDNLPKCGDLTVVNVLQALIKTACFLQEEIVGTSTNLIALESIVNQAVESPYTLPTNNCIGGVTNNSSTHDVVQAIVNTLCAFMTNVQTNYVLISDINTYIAQYLASAQGTGTKYYNRMVPFTAYEYYGDINGKFDNTGKGFDNTEWEKIYLCNGGNGTPDKRGRVAVGAIQNIPGPSLDPAVNPSSINPNYAKGDVWGANAITLTTDQIPSHKHENTAVTLISPNPHTHSYITPNANGSATGSANNHPDGPLVNKDTTGVTLTATTTMTNVNTGGDKSHSNIQPVIAAYYIMYLP